MVDTTVFKNGIKKLCTLALYHKAEIHTFPILVTNLKIIQGLREYRNAILNQNMPDMFEYFDAIDKYGSEDRSFIYINNNIPEGVIVFKVLNDIKIHRVYDYTVEHEPEQELESAIEDAIGAYFSKLKFDTSL